MPPAISAVSERIWDLKYRLKGTDGAPVDGDIADSWRRVARALAAPEADPARRAAAFEAAMADFRFLPAGRILAGAGSKRRVTLFNCFVMSRVRDDMAGIFDGLRDSALTMQQGGGIGVDFSSLRPRGARVRGVGADASGPVSFMKVWDAMCRTIMSAGHRRGAMMATLACDHPDIEAFVDAKREAGELRMFNLSVLATDAFMEAIRDGRGWPLRFAGETVREVPARDLWDRIMRATYDAAEPGVIFIDRVNARNNLAYCETIHATNPCGEQPLPDNGACLLGSINLARLVKAPFEDSAALDMGALRSLAATAVRMLDNAIDVSHYPLEAQAEEARAKRRIGLGVTGLADALILCGARYGGARAVQLTETWLRALRDAAYRASTDLAREKGAFPLFERDAFLAGETVSGLDPELREAIAAHGMRNGLVTSIAPTGTISLLADNVSSGIEPVYAFSHRRTVLMPGGPQSVEVRDHALRLFRERFGEEAPLPGAFVDVQSLTPRRPPGDAGRRAALRRQRHIEDDQLPRGDLVRGFRKRLPPRLGARLQGLHHLPPQRGDGAVLERAGEDGAKDQAELPLETLADAPADPFDAGRVVYMTRPLDRPEELPGTTYKLRWPESDHAIYVTVNDIVRDGRRRPFEIFINSRNMDHYAWTAGLMRMISAVFRRGGDVSFVVDELKAVFDPRGGQWVDGAYVPSLLAAIGETIEKHMVAIGFRRPDSGASSGAGSGARPRGCPRCGHAALMRQENCELCAHCGFSQCD